MDSKYSIRLVGFFFREFALEYAFQPKKLGYKKLFKILSIENYS